MKLTKTQRASLFAMFDGHCAYCGCDLQGKKWHADHIEPVEREWWKAHRSKTTATWDAANKCIVHVETDRKVTMGRPERDCIENMFPACSVCNLDKHCISLESWRRVLADKVGVLRRNYSAFRLAELYGMVTVKEHPIVFYFEQYTLDKEAAKL